MSTAHTPASWQARVTHDSKSAWRQVTPTKAEPTVEARVEYLKTVRRADGEPAYEFRALYVGTPVVVAATELLDALQSIADCCDEEHAARDYASRQTEIRGIARAAIAKAGGSNE